MAFMLSTGAALAQVANYDVVPLPKSVTTIQAPGFVLGEQTAVIYPEGNADMERNAHFLADYVCEMTQQALACQPLGKKDKVSKVARGNILLALDAKIQHEEGYQISVSAKGVTISGKTAAGVFRGIQTLRKSLPVLAEKPQAVSLPAVTIADEPRFSYRGVHLDCARHYFPVAVVKQYLDLLALHGCNQFHWHITDDQGWRFEVKALPDLAAKGSIRQQTVIGRNTGIYDGQPYGGYYTQDECREIVRYAAERYINVIPEIDLPGHMQAALHVYPNLGCTGGSYPVWQVWGVSDDVLCAGNPEVLTFIKTVLGELCDVFPSELIHIGGDECPKVRWKNCPKCQAKIRELQLKDDGRHSLENQLQSYINHEVEKFLTSRGRNLIGWDETLEGGLTEGAVVMSWRGVNGGIEAARQHHRVIMAPTDYCYIDYYQLKDTWNLPLGIGGYVPASKVYSFEPLVPGKLTEEEQQYILGPQVNLWTEYIAAPQHLFYMLLPRLDAISEVQWCQPAQKDFDDFKRRLPRMMQLYDRLAVGYCHAVE